MKKLAEAAGAGTMIAPAATTSPATTSPVAPQSTTKGSRGAEVTKHPYPTVNLEPFLTPRDRKGSTRVIRDRSGGIAFVREDALS